MKESNITNMNIDYLIKIGFDDKQIDLINDLVNRVIKEKLYINSHVPYHNIGHIERVLCYSVWILNMKKRNGEILNDTEILLYAALYHDCGRSLTVSNKMHGIKGAQKVSEYLKNDFDDKILKAIQLLIETHAKKTDAVDFQAFNYTDDEKRNIQALSDILKDADALDRNRIKLFKFAQCKPEYLRTQEAKKIYSLSNIFLSQYEEAVNR